MTTNRATSDYDALQLQLRRRLSRALAGSGFLHLVAFHRHRFVRLIRPGKLAGTSLVQLRYPA